MKNQAIQRDIRCDELPRKRFTKIRNDHLQNTGHEKDKAQKKPQHPGELVLEWRLKNLALPNAWRAFVEPIGKIDWVV